MGIRVLPDSAIVDRVSEFAFAEPERIDKLFALDRAGYIDAVFKFVQGLVSATSFLGSNRNALTKETEKLNEQLKASGCVDQAEFFDKWDRQAIREEASKWLDAKWPEIDGVLSDRRQTAAIAILGHISREFYYAWVLKDQGWDPHRYYADEANVHLSPAVLNRLTQHVYTLAGQFRVEVGEQAITKWIDQNIVSHYRIFREYAANLHEDYLPTLTRSSLSLRVTTQDPVEELVMPFVALKAIERVNRRADLLERVLEWKLGDGRDISRGIESLQNEFRSTLDQDSREHKLAHYKKLLGSGSIGIALAFLKAEIAGSDTSVYRWLWQIRSRSLNDQLSKRLEQLVYT